MEGSGLVTSQGSSVADPRFLASGNEAGTAPGDRRFRPDVEGLRAVAVTLVVLYHAGVPGLSGGFVGVDVFFVISGFVITGLLLRERVATARTSILDFYARRCRRILPAATLVLVATVVGTYLALGIVSGNNTADDGRWVAVFLANVHFESVGTNYLTAFRPPSPLQNYWSLSVEEQFYVVYPGLFLLVAKAKGRLSLRTRLAVVLGFIIVASYGLSIVQTSSHPASAYFSPFTRAWELALGALVAVSTAWLKQVPAKAAAILTWGGVAAIAYSAAAFDAHTSYPGSLVAVPVVGAALIIAGGTGVPRYGLEALIGRQPFTWLGKLSYSLYLWHWPILTIAAERLDKTSLPVGDNLLLVLVALAISMASYRLIENPIRHWSVPSSRSVSAGIGMVVTTIVGLSVVIGTQAVSLSSHVVRPSANSRGVISLVAAARNITVVPKTMEPTLAGVALDWGGSDEGTGCWAALAQTRESVCVRGDSRGSHLMVLYGDSHALMWLPAFDAIAKANRWKLVVLAKPSCPAELVTVANLPYYRSPGHPFLACDAWHQWAVGWIKTHRPNILVVTQEGPGTPGPSIFGLYDAPGADGSSRSSLISSAQWANGLTSLFQSVRGSEMRTVMLGNIPRLPQSGPSCLSVHSANVQACSAKTAASVSPFNAVEQATSFADGVQYINPVPWFCSTRCTAIIGNHEVYLDDLHITGSWARFLENLLAQDLGLLPVPST